MELVTKERDYVIAENTITALTSCYGRGLIAYAARYSGCVSIYDLGAKKETVQLRLDESHVTGLVFTCDGSYLISQSSIPNAKLSVWNANTGTCIYRNSDYQWKSILAHPQDPNLLAATHEVDGVELVLRIKLLLSASSAGIEQVTGFLELDSNSISAFSYVKQQKLPWADVLQKLNTAERASLRTVELAQGYIERRALEPAIETNGQLFWHDGSALAVNRAGTLAFMIGSDVEAAGQVVGVYDQGDLNSLYDDLFPLKTFSERILALAVVPNALGFESWLVLHSSGVLRLESMGLGDDSGSTLQWKVPGKPQDLVLCPSFETALVSTEDGAWFSLSITSESSPQLVESALGKESTIAVNPTFNYFITVNGPTVAKFSLDTGISEPTARYIALNSSRPVAASFHPLGLLFVVLYADRSANFYTAPNLDRSLQLLGQIRLEHDCSEIFWDRFGGAVGFKGLSSGILSFVSLNAAQDGVSILLKPTVASVNFGAARVHSVQFYSDSGSELVSKGANSQVKLAIADGRVQSLAKVYAVFETTSSKSCALLSLPFASIPSDAWTEYQATALSLSQLGGIGLYRFSDRVTHAIVPPRELYQGNEMLLAHVRGTEFLRQYALSNTAANVSPSTAQVEELVGGAPLLEPHLSQWNYPGDVARWILCSSAQDVLVAYHTSGALSAQSVLNESSFVLVSNAHDVNSYPLERDSPHRNGVSELVATLTSNAVYTVGGTDKLVKTWNWEPQNASQTSALQANSEEQVALQEAIAPFTFAGSLDEPESHIQDYGEETGDSERSESRAIEKDTAVDDAIDESLMVKVQFLKEKLAELHARNESDPETERLTKDELVLYDEERERLLLAINTELAAFENQTISRNNELELERAAILEQCRDAMRVQGRAIKSFLPDVHTGKLITVTNFPIRKLKDQDERVFQQVAMLRSVELAVKASLKQNNFQASVAVQKRQEFLEDASGGALKRQAPTSDVESLLYAGIDLNNDFRRRTQVQLLQSVVVFNQEAFNASFAVLAQKKATELGKIEEMNEKMNEMRQELARVESLGTGGIAQAANLSSVTGVPTVSASLKLHSAEVPEQYLEVREEELRSKKTLNASELAAKEAQAKRDQERARAAQQDDSFSRGLVAMMGGNLQIPKDELGGLEANLNVPSCLQEKRKEDWNDDERKQVSEYERKLQLVMEERDKQKRSLEAAYRKLNSGIQAKIAEFDDALAALFKLKLDAAKHEYVNELQSRKQLQRCLLLDEFDQKEKALIKQAEAWKALRATKLAALPEAKRELEKCRQIHDSSSKKNKDIERTFKKEFQRGNNVEYASLYKVFKHRGSDGDGTSPSFSDSVTSVDRERLLEFRERKIAAEQEEKEAVASFSSIQRVVNCRIEECDHLRDKIDAVGDQLVCIANSRYLLGVDLELLLHVKQCQVEMPQSAVVTDYSHAILIHRSNVEQLNAKIKQVGKGKLDAFSELRDYRKSISKMEWEKDVLDFRAEDLAQKIRWVQLLRVSKQMQDFLHRGMELNQSGQVAQLQVQAHYSTQRHAGQLAGLQKQLNMQESKLRKLQTENRQLQEKMTQLEQVVHQREEIFNARGGMAIRKGIEVNKALRQIQKHRQLTDLAKLQAQDLQLLESEAERLRLKTYPSFPAKPPAF